MTVLGCCDGYEKQGRNCVLVCDLDCNNGKCEVVENIAKRCECKAGYKGKFCDEGRQNFQRREFPINQKPILDCDPNFWGANCDNPCKCNSFSDCNKYSGECFCKSGRFGDNCEEEREKGEDDEGPSLLETKKPSKFHIKVAIWVIAITFFLININYGRGKRHLVSIFS